MQLTTEKLGVLDISDNEIINFPDGIPAFETVRRFAVVRNGRTAPFAWLQAADRPELSFLIINPWEFCYDYDLEISENDCRALDLARPEEAAVYAILTVRGNKHEITANLLAPLVINTRAGIGRQVINNSGKYTIRHQVMAEMARSQAVQKKPAGPRERPYGLRPAAAGR
ncbi:MAG: flagellar assembly protein FliW [bacterium]